MFINFNFNFKKYIKYFFLVFLCYFLFKSFNVKAGSYFDYVVNISTPYDIELSDVLYSGNTEDLDNYFISNYNINNYLSVLDVFKSKVATSMSYSNFEDLSNDYYYIIQNYVIPNSNYLSVSIFLYNKNNITNSDFAPRFSVQTSSSVPSSSSSYNVNIVPPYEYAFSVSFPSINRYGLSTSFNLSNGFARYNFDCTSSSSYCRSSFNSSSLTTTLNINGFISTRPMFYETNNSNFNFIFNTYNFNNSSSYFYRYLTINNDSLVYNLRDVIAYISFGSLIDVPNISDLGNNSFGISFNTIDNIFLDFENNSSSSIRCSTDRNFENNTCYLYSSDINDFNVNNTNVSNSAVFYFGNSDLILDSSKYYSFSFRIFTNYNLSIFTTIYNFVNNSTNYPFNIINTYVSDYTLYKDYTIVFSPTNSGTGHLQFINIVFGTLNKFTNSLDNNYSFGIFNTTRLTQYDVIPTLDDIKNENNTNSLDNISNSNLNSFFTDFRLNDFGLSSIVLYPLNFVSSFPNYTCSPLNLPLPRSMGSFQLPCVSSFMEENFLSIWDIYKLVFNGFIIYRILINLYSLIKNSYKPDNDRIEVVDL